MRCVHVPERTIDVRHITAPMRHSLIFDTFERLTPGEGFQIQRSRPLAPFLPFPCGASG